jgi:hypothetical protein
MTDAPPGPAGDSPPPPAPLDEAKAASDDELRPSSERGGCRRVISLATVDTRFTRGLSRRDSHVTVIATIDRRFIDHRFIGGMWDAELPTCTVRYVECHPGNESWIGQRDRYAKGK